MSTSRAAVTSHLINSKRWFDLLDKDKDGSITREELIEGVVAMLYEEDEQHQQEGQHQHQEEHEQEEGLETRQQHEKNDDHHHSSCPSSLPSSLSGCPAVHVNVEELFLVMDRNCSGTIDYQEFTHFYDMVLQSSSMKMERDYEEEGSEEEGEGRGKLVVDSFPLSTESDTPNSFANFDDSHHSGGDSSQEGARTAPPLEGGPTAPTPEGGVGGSSRKRKESLSESCATKVSRNHGCISSSSSQ